LPFISLLFTNRPTVFQPVSVTKDDIGDKAPASVNENGTSKPLTQEDEELEKRKARAARFGVPLVQPTKPKQARVRGNNSVSNPNPVVIKIDVRPFRL
jgi:hypothetical protein